MGVNRGVSFNKSGLVFHIDMLSNRVYNGVGNQVYNAINNSYNATLVNNPTFNSFGFFDFNGTNQYIDTNLKTSDFDATYTISVWCKRNSEDTQDCICGETNLTNDSYGAHMRLYNDSTFRCGHYKYSNNGYDEILYDIDTNNINTLEWHNYTFTRENGVEHKLYIDGVLVASESCDDVSNTSSNNLRICNDYYSVSRHLDGKIGTFSVYNKVLNADEVMQNYNALKDKYNVQKHFLLDNYSGAAVAYSASRKLKHDYSGAAFRVRRSSDNAELDIGFKNRLVDIVSLITFCAGTDGFVKTWYDQSGNGNNATQTTTANQPKIYDSSTGVLLVNNKPALFFDGSNDGLSHSAMSGTKFASFTVSKFETQLEIYQIIYSSKKSSGGSYSNFGASLLSYSNNTNMYFNTREGGSTGDTITYSNPGTNQILFSAYNDSAGVGTSNMKLFANGIEKGSLTNADPISFNASNYYDIGQERGVDPSSLHGYIQEVIMYTSVDQSSNRIGIETNINNHYGIY